jgi:hypothetical protein
LGLGETLELEKTGNISSAKPYTATTAPSTKTITRLPVDAAARKKVPVYSGVINYFPDALIAIAKVSQAGNDQHNPGQPLHWSRGKSADHEDTLVRHLLEKGTVDTDGHRHSAKMAWRALAILQLELEKERDEQIRDSTNGGS